MSEYLIACLSEADGAGGGGTDRTTDTECEEVREGGWRRQGFAVNRGAVCKGDSISTLRSALCRPRHMKSEHGEVIKEARAELSESSETIHHRNAGNKKKSQEKKRQHEMRKLHLKSCSDPFSCLCEG